MALGGEHGTEDTGCIDAGTARPGTAKLGAVRDVIASHEATWDASAPLSNGPCDSDGVVKGLCTEDGSGTICQTKARIATTSTMEWRILRRANAVAFMRPTVQVEARPCQDESAHRRRQP